MSSTLLSDSPEERTRIIESWYRFQQARIEYDYRKRMEQATKQFHKEMADVREELRDAVARAYCTGWNDALAKVEQGIDVPYLRPSNELSPSGRWKMVEVYDPFGR